MLTPATQWDAEDKCQKCNHSFREHYQTFFDGMLQKGCRVKNHNRGKTKICYCSGFSP